MRKFVVIIALAVGLSLSACTPQEVIYMTFGAGGGGNASLAAQAERVAWCESEHKPWAVSPTNDHGLFQINKKYHYSNFTAVTGQSWDKVYDPYWNAYYAKWLYNNKGWQPWACRHAA